MCWSRKTCASTSRTTRQDDEPDRDAHLPDRDRHRGDRLANRFAGLMVNLTNSEPAGIYLHVRGKPERGGMVALRSLMKHVVAVPGDVVTVIAQGTYVNGQLFPHSAIPATAKGYQPFPFRRIPCNRGNIGCSVPAPIVGTAATSDRCQSISLRAALSQSGRPATATPRLRARNNSPTQEEPMKVNLKHTFGKLGEYNIRLPIALKQRLEKTRALAEELDVDIAAPRSTTLTNLKASWRRASTRSLHSVKSEGTRSPFDCE